MPQQEPRVRARHCQDWLEHFDTEDEPWRSRLREKMAPGLREAIEASSRVGWLPLEMHVKLADVLLESVGEVHAHAFYRRAASEWTRGPIFGPLFRTGARLFDVTPATAIRWAPRAWDMSFRDAGEMSAESQAPGHGRLVYRGLPPICTASEAWMISAQGSAYGVLDVIGFEGVVRLDTSGKNEGAMLLDIEWFVPSQR